MTLPAFNEDGDLPPGVHGAALSEVLVRFGQGSVQRGAVADRLTRLYQLATSTGQVARVAVFGSFITAKAEPNDSEYMRTNTVGLRRLTPSVRLRFPNAI